MSKVTVRGKEGISATIVADSISKDGVRLTTMELEYPRFILAEVNTHRMLSKNSASSRAIPVKTMNDFIENNPAMPVHWGQNQSGMQAKQELEQSAKNGAMASWLAARNNAVASVKVMVDIGLHKQIANRVTETWQRMKSIVSGTEWLNLDHLRNHGDAQPEFHELARCINEARSLSQPEVLDVGEWHLPYVITKRNKIGQQTYWADEYMEIDLETALKISSSCCAQVSYRKLDESVNKAIDIYNRLVTAEVVHASPFEHQGTPVDNSKYWGNQNGTTHIDRNNMIWSGNFRQWIQHRQLIPNNAVYG